MNGLEDSNNKLRRELEKLRIQFNENDIELKSIILIYLLLAESITNKYKTAEPIRTNSIEIETLKSKSLFLISSIKVLTSLISAKLSGKKIITSDVYKIINLIN